MRTVLIAGAAIMAGCVFFQPVQVSAANLDSAGEASKIVQHQDSGTKAKIVGLKQKVAEERSGILAASKRLAESRKSKDRALVDGVKKEVDAEIAERKARINGLKDQIGVLQSGGGGVAPSSKSRTEDKQ